MKKSEEFIVDVIVFIVRFIVGAGIGFFCSSKLVGALVIGYIEPSPARIAIPALIATGMGLSLAIWGDKAFKGKMGTLMHPVLILVLLIMWWDVFWRD